MAPLWRGHPPGWRRGLWALGPGGPGMGTLKRNKVGDSALHSLPVLEVMCLIEFVWKFVNVLVLLCFRLLFFCVGHGFLHFVVFLLYDRCYSLFLFPESFCKSVGLNPYLVG